MKSSSLSNAKKPLTKKGVSIPSNPENRVKSSKLLSKKENKSSNEILKQPGPKTFTVVAIGASAGGLEAISLILKNLSPNTGMAYIYVQHLSPDHKSMLPVLLSKVTSMIVKEIDEMVTLEPNHLYIIPYNKAIEVTDGHIKLIARAKNNHSNLSIDILFSSLAETHKENVIGIVLSGSANDGTRGMKEIKAAGGITFAQDDSAKYGSMPNSAIAEGIVDFVLSPEEIAKELNWIGNHPLLKITERKNLSEEFIEYNNPDLKFILQLLNKVKLVDFSHYKLNTIKRRILRRMLICRLKSLKMYGKLLEDDKDEIDLLYRDLLINVTEFFRDNDAFKLLKKNILTKLLKSKEQGETLRIWVPACASGEEVYSIAMTLLELQGDKSNNIPFQIFASDLSTDAILEARSGKYSINRLKNVSPIRLKRFFTKTKDHYRISKTLRDVCVFAQHNLLVDPPFSHMDFISCRNLLIYLDTTAQKKAMATFHYALNEGGVLMLGKSETIGTSTTLFTPINKIYKIYTRKKNNSLFRSSELNMMRSKQSKPGNNNHPIQEIKKSTIASSPNLGIAFDNILLNQYVPASVIINYELDILYFRGNTANYLKHHAGKASFNILKMAHKEIIFELRNAIHHAIKTKLIVRKLGLEMNRDSKANQVQIVNLEVTPLSLNDEEPLLMIVFSGQVQSITETVSTTEHPHHFVSDNRIKKLEQELDSVRADMGSITQDQEAALEELQSANEEIVSSNEELQSLNEELETSKEEIESTNEELTTSNHELQARIQQVEELYTYYESILSTVHEPVLILNSNMSVKSANHSFCKLFETSEAECVGVSFFKLNNSQWNIPQLRELLEEIIPMNIRFHDFEVENNFGKVGNKTLLLNAHRILQQSLNEALIVLTISDITEVKRLAIALQINDRKVLEAEFEANNKTMRLIAESNKRYKMLLMKSPFAFAVLKGVDMVVTIANDSIKELWGKGQNIEGKPLLTVLPELKGGDLPAKILDVFNTGIAYHGYEVLVPILRHGILENAYFNFVYQPYLEADETISGIAIISYEVTEHVIAKNELIEAKRIADEKTLLAEDAVKGKQQFLSNMSHEIRTPMNSIIGFTKVILKTELSLKQKEYLNAIKISGEALIVLINDILDLAKVDSGKMSFEVTPFRMATTLSAMMHLFETKIQEKNLAMISNYDARIPEIVIGDPVRLHQIMLNLLSNAVKFTHQGSITITTKLIEEKPELVNVLFSVKDTGIGIEASKIDYIFDNFQQATTETSRLYGGTGLGLAIVKQLVERQGGEVSVVSKINSGTTFSFNLIFKKSYGAIPENITNIEDGTPEEAKNIKVLVVEDIPLNQLLMKTLLEDFGFEQDIVSNGKIAIEMLRSNTYDIVLMDLQMPEMNGFEATEYIRNTLHSQIPIIALTADVTTVDLAKCKLVGMNDYIAKPIDERILYQKIISTVNRKSVPGTPLVNQTNPTQTSTLKFSNLSKINERTRGNIQLNIELVSLYLEQTPPLIEAIQTGFANNNFTLAQAAIHKIIPSFSLMGMEPVWEEICHKLSEDARAELQNADSSKQLQKLIKHLNLASDELKKELQKMKLLIG